eukprot:2901769-Rhodomonas_salina.2
MLQQWPIRLVHGCLQTVIPINPSSAGLTSSSKAGGRDTSLDSDTAGACTAPCAVRFSLRSLSTSFDFPPSRGVMPTICDANNLGIKPLEGRNGDVHCCRMTPDDFDDRGLGPARGAYGDGDGDGDGGDEW